MPAYAIFFHDTRNISKISNKSQILRNSTQILKKNSENFLNIEILKTKIELKYSSIIPNKLEKVN